MTSYIIQGDRSATLMTYNLYDTLNLNYDLGVNPDNSLKIISLSHNVLTMPLVHVRRPGEEVTS